MLLHARNNNTLRLLDRHDGAEIRYNRQVFFANDDLAKIIKFVIRSSAGDDVFSHDVQPAFDEETVRHTLKTLSESGIPLSFWGGVWSQTGSCCVNDRFRRKGR